MILLIWVVLVVSTVAVGFTLRSSLFHLKHRLTRIPIAIAPRLPAGWQESLVSGRTRAGD